MFISPPELRLLSIRASREKRPSVVRLRFLPAIAYLSLAAFLGILGSACGSKTVSSAPPVPHSVTLNWKASTTHVIGYRVYRASKSGGPYTLKFPPVIGTSYVDTNVQAGQTYFYVVTAVDEFGRESIHSNETSVTVPSP